MQREVIMVNLNPAKAPLHGSGDTVPSRLSAGAQPPQAARSVSAPDSRIPDALRDLETGIRPHSSLSQTLGGAPQGERTGRISQVFPLACRSSLYPTPFTFEAAEKTEQIVH